MLKKNQLALILLTLVMMLTIYYIQSPFDKPKKDPEPDDQQTTGRLSELAELRLALREERTQTVMGLDAIIADSEKTMSEKNAALDQKKYINGLTEKELLLELQIINKGYRDAFVHATDTAVIVTVVAPEHSMTVANEILLMAFSGFGDYNIKIEFSTVEQVMGKVAS